MIRTCLKRSVTSTNADNEFERTKKKVKFEDGVSMRVYTRNPEEWTAFDAQPQMDHQGQMISGGENIRAEEKRRECYPNMVEIMPWSLSTVDVPFFYTHHEQKSLTKIVEEDRIAKLEREKRNCDNSVDSEGSTSTPELELIDEGTVVVGSEFIPEIPLELIVDEMEEVYEEEVNQREVYEEEVNQRESNPDIENQIISKISTILQVPPITTEKCAKVPNRYGTSKNSSEICADILELFNFNQLSETEHDREKRVTERRAEKEVNPMDKNDFLNQSEPEEQTEEEENEEEQINEEDKEEEQINEEEKDEEQIEEEKQIEEEEREEEQIEEKDEEEEQINEEDKEEEQINEEEKDEEQIEEEKQIEEEDEEDEEEEVDDVLPPFFDNSEEDNDVQISEKSERQQPILLLSALRRNECHASTSEPKQPIQSDASANNPEPHPKAPEPQKQPPIPQESRQPSPSREAFSSCKDQFLRSGRSNGSQSVNQPILITTNDTNRQEKVAGQTQTHHSKVRQSGREKDCWWLKPKNKRRENKRRKKELDRKRQQEHIANAMRSQTVPVSTSVPLNQLNAVTDPVATFSPPTTPSVTLPSQSIQSCSMELCSPQESPPRPPHPIPPPPMQKMADDMPPPPSEVYKIGEHFYFKNSITPQPITDLRLHPFVIDCRFLFTNGFCSYTTNCKFSHGNNQRTKGWFDAEKKTILLERENSVQTPKNPRLSMEQLLHLSNLPPKKGPLRSILLQHQSPLVRSRRSNSRCESPTAYSRRSTSRSRHESPSARSRRSNSRSRHESPSARSRRSNSRSRHESPSARSRRSNSRSRHESPSARSRRSNSRSRHESPSARSRRSNSRSRHESPSARSRRSNSRSRHESPSARSRRSNSLIR